MGAIRRSSVDGLPAARRTCPSGISATILARHDPSICFSRRCTRDECFSAERISGDKRVERRLAAILVADVAGYSRLMGADEAGTHMRLMAHRRDVIDPHVSECHGRIVKTTGDGLLVEFASVVDAVQCAVTIQRRMAVRNSTGVPGERIEFRMGINLGDVIVERDDIYGDGVNIAARLEGIAEPGSVYLSRAAHDQVKGKLDICVRDMGERRLKNIAEPIQVHAILPEAESVAADTHRGRASPMLREPRLSIVVLPFANLSGDAEQDYLADGLTEDLTSELSRLPEFFVIARSSAFTYKGIPHDVKHTARELNVRYLLEGSIRRMGNRVRVTAHLIEGETASHVWGDRFDRELSDVFDLQESIALELANVLGIKLVEAESRRSKRSSSPDAIDLIMRARAAFNRGAYRESRAAAQQLYEAALQVAPDDARALTGLSITLGGNVANQWSKEPDEELRRAEALARQAMALELDVAACHYALGVVRRLQFRFDEAQHHLEPAMALNPSMHVAYAQLGYVKVFSGRSDEAQRDFEECIRLSPRDPMLFLGFFGIGWLRLMLGDDSQAIEACRKAIALNPDYAPSYLCLAAAFGMCGRLNEATGALKAYLRTGTPLGTISLLQTRSLSNHPVYLAQRERLYEGLRRAGMPDE